MREYIYIYIYIYIEEEEEEEEEEEKVHEFDKMYVDKSKNGRYYICLGVRLLCRRVSTFDFVWI